MAKAALKQLSQCGQGDLSVRLPGHDQATVFPALGVRLLKQILGSMADGNAAQLQSIPVELSTRQAADLLGVSHPFLIQQLDAGLIAYAQVGIRRRIRFVDLMDYRRSMLKERAQALDALSEDAQASDPEY